MSTTEQGRWIKVHKTKTIKVGKCFVKRGNDIFMFFINNKLTYTRIGDVSHLVIGPIERKRVGYSTQLTVAGWQRLSVNGRSTWERAPMINSEDQHKE